MRIGKYNLSVLNDVDGNLGAFRKSPVKFLSSQQRRLRPFVLGDIAYGFYGPNDISRGIAQSRSRAI